MTDRYKAMLTKHYGSVDITIQCIKDDGHDRLLDDGWIEGKDPRIHEFRDRWLES